MVRTPEQMIQNTAPGEWFDDAFQNGWSLHVMLDRKPNGQINGRFVVTHRGSERSTQVMNGLGTSSVKAQAVLRQCALKWIDEYCSACSVSGGGTG
jgi:hypothetical protein